MASKLAHCVGCVKYVFVTLFQIQRHNIMVRDAKIQVTYFSNVCAENIIVKT